MFAFIDRFRGFFPKVHLIAASVCTLLVLAVLILLPSQEVSATRSTQALVLPTPEYTPAPLDSALVSTTGLETKAEESALLDDIEPQAAEIEWQEFSVRKGDSLSLVFNRAGLSAQTLYSVTNATRDNKALSRIYPGQKLFFHITGDDELAAMKLENSVTKTTYIEKTDLGYVTRVVERQPEVQHRFASGIINNSLFLDGEKAGLSSKIIMELAGIFGWDVDFSLDIREGDSFSLIYEQKFLDGEFIGEGDIIAAEFVNQGDTFTAVRFTDSKGNTSYFAPDGKSMRKAFLRSPVDFTRISSSFRKNRFHPVLNRVRDHKGTDYAASTGTPIKSSGDGKIIFRGKKGGYGNVVIVQHGSSISTLYAHMSNFKRGQRVGTRVKQGEVIGFVGMSGTATGPHLHYEFRVNGVHKNPVTVKFPHAAPVAKSERSAFDAVAGTLTSQLNTYKSSMVATAAP